MFGGTYLQAATHSYHTNVIPALELRSVLNGILEYFSTVVLFVAKTFPHWTCLIVHWLLFGVFLDINTYIALKMTQ